MDERVKELEIKVTYQERLLEELNQAVIEQGKELDGLRRKLALLTDRVKAHERPDEVPDEPPPHY